MKFTHSLLYKSHICPQGITSNVCPWSKTSLEERRQQLKNLQKQLEILEVEEVIETVICFMY